MITKSSHKEPTNNTITALLSLFQQSPSHIEKPHGKSWTTVHGNISITEKKSLVFRHLSPTEKISIGTLATWYPAMLEIDVDHGGEDLCHEVQEELKLRDDQVQLYQSERKGGYRLRTRICQETRTTSRYLETKMIALEQKFGVEIYPKRNKHVRFPFDPLFTPVNRIADMCVNDLVQDFFNLEPIDINALAWTETRTPQFTSGKTGYSLQRGRATIENGLDNDGQRYAFQWDMMRVFYAQGLNQEQAITQAFNILSTKGHISKDVLQVPQRVIKELEWCANKIWNNSYKVHDELRRDALPLWIEICGNDVTFLRFCLGIVSYLAPRHKKGVSIPLSREKMLEFSSTRNCGKYINKLLDIGFFTRGDAYFSKTFSKRVTINRPDLLGFEPPYLDEKGIPVTGINTLTHAPKIMEEYKNSLQPRSKQTLSKFLK